MIRTRLILWNALVFAFALTLIGTIIYITTRTALYRSVDDDLLTRASGMPRGPGGPDGPPNRIRGEGPVTFGPAGQRGPGGGGVFVERGRPGFGVGESENRSDEDIPYIYKVDRRDHFFGGPSASELQDIDPILAKRIALSFRLGRPRFVSFSKDSQGPFKDDPLDPVALSDSVSGKPGWSVQDLEGHRIRVYTVPIKEKGKVMGAMQLAANLDDVDAVVRRLGTILLASLPIALLATTILGIWLTNRSLRPVLAISEAAERIGESNLSDRLPVAGCDEFAILSGRFNSMLDRIEFSFTRLGQAYEAQRRFVADASHELKTPLTTVKGRVGVALRGTHSPERYREHLEAIGRAADSMASIIQDLLLLARSDEVQTRIRKQHHSLRDIGEEAVAAATAASPREVIIDIPGDLTAPLEPTLFGRALTNLVRNAIRHTPAEKPIIVRARRDGDMAVVEVADEGEGIPSEHLPLLFNRFHRVDSARDRVSGGTGLGLSIVKSIVEAHGGTVAIASEICVATTVTISLPLNARG